MSNAINLQLTIEPCGNCMYMDEEVEEMRMTR